MTLACEDFFQKSGLIVLTNAYLYRQPEPPSKFIKLSKKLVEKTGFQLFKRS